MTEELLIVESYVNVKQLAQLILTVITFTNTQDWSSSSHTLPTARQKQLSPNFIHPSIFFFPRLMNNFVLFQ